MKTAHECIDNAITDLERLKISLKRKKTKQINNSEERSIIKATALAWFNNYRSRVVNIIGSELSRAVDELYKKILSASDRATSRTRYDSLLKSIKIELSQIRGHVVMPTTSQSTPLTTDDPPKFDPLITDSQMQQILTNRWRECCNCLSANAPLAATVMMGGLLEALLLAKVNKSNKSLIFKTKSAPKDNSTGKTLILKEWTLKNYIDVAHELKWISHSAKDVGEVLRDYRNYVHPYKELSHNVALVDDDARLFWEIVKNIGRQIIRNNC
jgi:hypothetical protein